MRQLAIKPRVEVRRLRLDAGQPARKQRKALAAPARRRRHGPHPSRCPRRNGPRHEPRSRARAIRVCAGDGRVEDTALGMMRGWRSSSLTFVCSSVTPEKALKSPAERVVGTLICRTVGAFIGGRADGAVSALDGAQRVRLHRGADVIGKAHLNGLGAVRDRSSADSDDEIGLDGPRLFRRPQHRRAGRVRRHAVPDGRAAVAEGRLHPGNLVGVAVERARHHQEHARGAEPPRFLCDGLSGGLAEDHSVHGPEIDASQCCHVT